LALCLNHRIAFNLTPTHYQASEPYPSLGVNAMNLENVLGTWKTFLAISSPTIVTDERFLIDLPMDGFPQMGCDNDHLGASMPVGAPSTPSP
jgi:hypothetical protein